jgi:hypothetical protein
MAEQAAGTIVNSAGTLASSILESVGYHYQSLILDQLGKPLNEEVGALIYLFGVALAIFMTATQGGYKMGTWLLIGPPLFFATILPRGDIDNAAWRFGRQIRNDADVEKGTQDALKGAGGQAGGTANVSKLFRSFVKLASVSQQEIIHLMTKNRRKADLALVVRAELFSQIHINKFDKLGLQRLFHRAMFGECGEALRHARAANDGLFRPAEYANITALTNDKTEEGQQATVNLGSRQANALEMFKQAAEHKQNLDGETARLIASSAFGDQEAILDKMSELQIKPYSCHDIWKLVLFYVKQQADQDLNSLLSRGAQLGVSKENVMNIILQAHGEKIDKPIVTDDGTAPQFSEDDVLLINKILSKYILRNEYRSDSVSSRMAYWITNHETPDVRMKFAGKESLTEQARTAMQEWSERQQMIHSAASLPYYQGLGLFVLGATFPFFALLLLIPGKQSGFLLWFMLWIWLKSWDIAMTIVMLLDDVIFSILSVQNQEVGVVQGKNELEKLDLVFASIQEMDPTFQLSTYYTIISTAIMAIIPTTAYVLLGGLKGGAGLLSAGVSRSSIQAGSQFLGAAQQFATNNSRRDFNDDKISRMQMYMSNSAAGNALHQGVKDGKGNPVNPSRNSAVNAPALTSAGGARSRSFPGASGKTNPQQASQPLGDFENRQLADAQRAGAAAGLRGSRRFGKIDNPKIVDILMKSTTAADANYGPLHQQSTATFGASQTAAAHRAVFDAEIDPYELAIMNSVYQSGALVIPSPNFVSSYAGAESNEDYLIKRFEENQARKKAELGFQRDIIASAREGITQVLSAAYDDARATQEGIGHGKTIDDETRNALLRDAERVKTSAGTLTTDQIRSLSPQTQNYLKQKIPNGADIFRNIGAVVAGTGMYQNDTLREGAGNVRDSTWSMGRRMYGAIYGDTYEQKGIGEMGEAFISEDGNSPNTLNPRKDIRGVFQKLPK